jgi:uncharacterized membrane protein
LTRIEKSIEISAPPQKIIHSPIEIMFLNFMIQSRALSGLPRKKSKDGSTIHVFSELAGIKGEYDAEVTEVIDNEKAAWRTTSGNVTVVYYMTLKSTKTGTLVTTSFDYELPFSNLGKIIDKLRVHKALEKDTETGLKRLKRLWRNKTFKESGEETLSLFFICY